MANEKILVVDDDEDIVELIRYNLMKSGYHTDGAFSGEEAVAKARRNKPDLIVLDLMLPGIDGLDVCRSIKSDASLANASIVILSAKGEETDIVIGLEMGADDYITKPFSPRVLLARIKAVLRRRKQSVPGSNQAFSIHEIHIIPEKREVRTDGNPVELTVTEFNLLNFLCRRPGYVFTRSQIIEKTKGDDYPVTDRSIDVQIVGLRRKLGKSGRYIETIRGVGYRFKE
jgi:two-component system, OmpR family, alkaline phosphatase synthesis response regulator PhoP